MKEAFKHDYNREPFNRSRRTFSVGIFQWIPKSSGNGLKKSAVKLRIKGYSNKPEKVYEAATFWCKCLDAGIEIKQKTLSV